MCTCLFIYFFKNSNFRHYLLDLMRVTPRDANYTGPGSRFCILRPELITAFCQVSYDILRSTLLWDLFHIFIFNINVCFMGEGPSSRKIKM